ncbi:MAG: mechanosensitive ion channel family protein [Gammaproteobacteria bacterium]
MSMTLERLWSLPVFNNSVTVWLVGVAIAAGVLITLLTARRMARRYHRRLEHVEGAKIVLIPLEVLSRTALPFFVVLALFVGLQSLEIGPRTAAVFSSAITIAVFWQAGIWGVAGASALIEHKRRRSLGVDRAVLGSLGIINVIVNTVIWAFVALLTLGNLGVDITALVAGLGIGGIAVALAVQNIFGDLFASLSITLDRPFTVGDFLVVDDVLGTVETIGVKSTRLRSLSGEQIVMANSDLLGSRVRNYGRMSERRVLFTTGVTYETKMEALKRIPSLIREIIQAQEDTRFDRSHFAKHAAASLDFETVYYVRSADYNRYMDIQQSINLRLHEEFAKREIEFAYPTQKLFVASIPQDEAA